MQMVRHHDVSMKNELRFTVMNERLNHQPRPALVPKERLALYRLSRNEVGRFVRSSNFSFRSHPFPAVKVALSCLVDLRANARFQYSEPSTKQRSLGPAVFVKFE